jgi:hypothetical protein
MILLGVVRGEGGEMRKEVRWEERSLSPPALYSECPRRCRDSVRIRRWRCLWESYRAMAMQMNIPDGTRPQRSRLGGLYGCEKETDEAIHASRERKITAVGTKR